MIENPEYRARLRRKLEKWPDGKGCPVTINDGLELLAMVEHQEKTIKEWRKRFKNRGRKNKALKSKISRLEQEADWLADKLEKFCHCDNGMCTMLNIKKCPFFPDGKIFTECHDLKCKGEAVNWREAARNAVEKENETNSGSN